jgi:hypothetical protein
MYVFGNVGLPQQPSEMLEYETVLPTSNGAIAAGMEDSGSPALTRSCEEFGLDSSGRNGCRIEGENGCSLRLLDGYATRLAL